MGTSFDRLTYEQIIGMPRDELMASQDPRVATLMSALVRELGGNFGLLAACSSWPFPLPAIDEARSGHGMRSGYCRFMRRWIWLP